MASPPDLSAARIGQIAVVVQDVPRAVAFYSNTLGLPFLFEAPGLAFFDCGGVRLMLSRAPRPDLDHAGSILYYFVPDIRAAFEELRRRGVAFEDEPHLIARMPDHELWLAEFRDSEGNVLALMSEVRG